ncbi:MAG TPA: ATP-binding protein [Clostridia bacterium]|nr:ATP-binding protein [Clostridia bacterium]
MSLDEILTNTVGYGFKDSEEHEIIVKFVLYNKTLTIEIRDDGIPFNPLKQPEPDLSQNIEERPIGGLGIHLVRKMMDAVDYRREEGCNILTIKKHIAT